MYVTLNPKPLKPLFRTDSPIHVNTSPATSSNGSDSGRWFPLPEVLQQAGSIGIGIGQPLWCYCPKIHAFHHFIIEMRQACQMHTPAFNVLGFSCSQAEDFIGRATASEALVTSAKRAAQYQVSRSHFPCGCQNCSESGLDEVACGSHAAMDPWLRPGQRLS